jgi:hypothetical protein
MASEPLNYHAARLLLLVAAWSKSPRGRIDGLTQIAKLDFLLRYPVFLERILRARGRQMPPDTRPTGAERGAVESSMIRYKYGPWDDRYYAIIGRLVGLQLVEYTVGRGNVTLRATELGKSVADELERVEWKIVADRCRLLRRELDLSGSNLKKAIYAELPEAVDRPWWDVIPTPINGSRDE